MWKSALCYQWIRCGQVDRISTAISRLKQHADNFDRKEEKAAMGQRHRRGDKEKKGREMRGGMVIHWAPCQLDLSAINANQGMLLLIH